MAPMPMIVFRVFLSQTRDERGRRAEGTLGGVGGRFRRRGRFPMIECNEGAGTGRPAAQMGVGHRWGTCFPGMVGCRRALAEFHAPIVARTFYRSKRGRGGPTPGQDGSG